MYTRTASKKGHPGDSGSARRESAPLTVRQLPQAPPPPFAGCPPARGAAPRGLSGSRPPHGRSAGCFASSAHLACPWAPRGCRAGDRSRSAARPEAAGEPPRRASSAGPGPRGARSRSSTASRRGPAAARAAGSHMKARALWHSREALAAHSVQLRHHRNLRSSTSQQRARELGTTARPQRPSPGTSHGLCSSSSIDRFPPISATRRFAVALSSSQTSIRQR